MLAHNAIAGPPFRSLAPPGKARVAKAMLDHAAGFAGNDLCNAQHPEEPDRRSQGISRAASRLVGSEQKNARFHAFLVIWHLHSPFR
jgi:hypothetical protein